MTEAVGIDILHVDDNQGFLEAAANILESERDHFSVETAVGASEALDRLSESEFDCVVSDYKMTGQNGIELLKMIRERYPDLPFILFTGEGSEKIASNAFSAGATDYVRKSVDSDQYELLANRINNLVERDRAQRRATNLDRIRILTSDINQALIRAESRSMAETRVCEIISKSDPYLFAWIGEVDPDSQQVEPRASAGVDKGYLDDITITVDDTPTAYGPGGTAIRERRVAVSQNVARDNQFEPWREEAIERGFRGVAAVPLEHQDTLYGELLVYANRPHAFDKKEQELLGELGRDIAYAIHSLELKKKVREERNKKDALFENAPNPVIYSEEHGDTHQIVNVNGAFEEIFEYTSEEIVGTDITETIVPDDRIADHKEYREQVMAGEAVSTETERMTVRGPREFLLDVIPYVAVEGTVHGTYSWYRDITDRKQREQAVDRANSILRTVLENLPMGVLVEDAERDILMTNDQLGTTFDVPLTGNDLIGRDCNEAAEQLKDLFDDPEGFIEGIDKRLEQREAVYNEELHLADGRVVERDYLPYSLPEGKANLWLYRDITTRIKYEQTLEQLLASTQDLQSATTSEEVATVGAETAKEVFERPVTGIHFYDENMDTLVPVAWTEDVENSLGMEPPALPVESTLAGQVYRTGDSASYKNISEKEDCFYSETPFESKLIYPLGDHGVLILSSTESGAFDQVDKTLAQILTANLETALNRVKQREKLENQKERLNEFASVLSHDLRNPLNVAEGRLELARAECDSEEHFEPIVRSHTRMRTLIEDLLKLAREGTDVGELESVDLASFVSTCWKNVDTKQATIVTDIDQRIRADRSRLQQLLENLIRNAVEHGGPETTITVGSVNNGFFVEDDGPGIPPEDRSGVFDLGYSTADEGTGFGLAIIKRIVEAHGWEITVTDGTDGGARFEVTGVKITAE